MKSNILLLGLALTLSACSTTSDHTTERPADSTHWAGAVDKEANLYNLDGKLFRSEQLSPQSYALLKQQNIKTLINLRFFDRNDDLQAFGNTDLKLVNTPLLTWAISPKDVANVLWEIEQAQKQGAVLVHCYHGADRTGLISAMYRVVYQDWTLAEAKREMLQGGYGFHAIWKNIENFFTEQNVKEIKAYLAELRQ